MSFKYMKHNRELNLLEKLYFPEIGKGMMVTLRHFIRNWLLIKKDVVTKQYPEEKFDLSYRTRGRHYLTQRSDGRISCVACMMCAMACPANVIKIEIAELDEPYYTDRQKIERAPKSFTIDQLACIYCGMCVEACPEDAIRMDSGETMIAVDDRKDAIVTIDQLIKPPNQEHEMFTNPLPTEQIPEAPLKVLPEDNAMKQKEY